MTLSTKELKHARAGFIKELQVLGAKLKDGDLDEADQSRFDDLEKCIKDHDDRISKMESVMQLSADDDDGPADEQEMSAPVGTNIVAKGTDFNALMRDERRFPVKSLPNFNIMTSPKRPAGEKKGTQYARFVLGSVLNQKMGGNAGLRYVQYAFDDAIVAKALSSNGGQSVGGALIPQDFAVDLIDLLCSATVVRGSQPWVMPMPNGNLTFPRLNGAATAVWINEEDDLTVSQPSFDNIQFTAHKLGAFVNVSNDLIRRAPLSVESIIRTNSVKMLARAEDIAFLTGDGTAKKITGMTNLALAGSTHNQFGVFSLAVALNTLAEMELDLKINNIDPKASHATWFMPPNVISGLKTLTDLTGRYFFKDELDQGKLYGYPYKETTQLPCNLTGSGNLSSDGSQIILAAMDEVMIADTLDMFADSSDVAGYWNGASQVNTMTRDETVFRTLSEVDFNLAHPAAVSVTTVKNWSPSGFTGVAGAAFTTQAQNSTKSSAGSANPT